jgi:hypothetical protein
VEHYLPSKLSGKDLPVVFYSGRPCYDTIVKTSTSLITSTSAFFRCMTTLLKIESKQKKGINVRHSAILLYPLENIIYI